MASRLETIRDRIENFHRTALFTQPARAIRESRQSLDRLSDDLNRTGTGWIQDHRLALERASVVLRSGSPDKRITDALRQLVDFRVAMKRTCDDRMQEIRSRLEQSSAVLGALSPTAALGRGYTLTLDSGGRLVRSASSVAGGEEILTRFADGSIWSVVK